MRTRDICFTGSRHTGHRGDGISVRAHVRHTARWEHGTNTTARIRSKHTTQTLLSGASSGAGVSSPPGTESRLSGATKLSRSTVFFSTVIMPKSSNMRTKLRYGPGNASTMPSVAKHNNETSSSLVTIIVASFGCASRAKQMHPLPMIVGLGPKQMQLSA